MQEEKKGRLNKKKNNASENLTNSLKIIEPHPPK